MVCIDLDEVAVVAEREEDVEEYPFLQAAFGLLVVVSGIDLIDSVCMVVKDGRLEKVRKLA